MTLNWYFDNILNEEYLILMIFDIFIWNRSHDIPRNKKLLRTNEYSFKIYLI